MHLSSISLVAVLAFTAKALPVTEPEMVEIEARKVSPISEAAVQLVERLEGFRSNYYYINGDKTIG